MGDGSAPAVSVTVVLYNSERELDACIRSIRPELEDGFAELIAVDNASPDRSVAVVEREAPEAHVLRAERNRGFATGANLAWPHVRGRYWMLLNPDVTLEPGALGALVSWMDRRPQIGIASAELRDGDGGGPLSAGRALPSPWRPLLEASRLHLLLSRGLRGRLLRGAYWTGGDQLDAGWVPCTAVIARRDAVEVTGLLDERFFLYGEDMEWCWRMRQAGWGVGVCSGVQARHRGSSSAVRTYGYTETRLQMALGELNAIQLARGYTHALLYAWTTAAALALEAMAPRRRSKGRRTSARAAARIWHAAARSFKQRPHL
jgi:GT2 family glycosyltransferase